MTNLCTRMEGFSFIFLLEHLFISAYSAHLKSWHYVPAEIDAHLGYFLSLPCGYRWEVLAVAVYLSFTSKLQLVSKLLITKGNFIHILFPTVFLTRVYMESVQRK